MEFIPFQPAHLAAIVPHPTQGPVWMPPDDVLRAMMVPGIATTGVLVSSPLDAADVHGNPSRTTHRGVIIGAAGVLPVRPGLAQAWAVFGDIPKPCWPAVVGRIRVALERAHLAGARRIEAQVRRGFGPGVRLARLLGFEVEGILRAWGPDGSDYFMYAKIARGAALSAEDQPMPGFASPRDAIAEASPCKPVSPPNAADVLGNPSRTTHSGATNEGQ